jgi:uncharacterized protein (TIGR00730 family)
MKKEKLKHSQLAAFGSTCRFGKPAKDDKGLQTELARGYQNLFRSTQVERESPKDPPPIKESGRFNVAVFCSATARNEKLNSDAKQLGSYLAGNDFGLVYGAGDRKMMGSVFSGVCEQRAKGKAGWISASSVDHILEIEADKPAIFKTPRSAANPTGPDDYYDAATIYDRMDYMMRTADAFTVIPGGAGTLQELVLLLMLKKSGHPAMANKPIILLNQMTFDNGKSLQFYQPLLDMIPREELKTLDVRVCNSMDEVQKQVDAARSEALTRAGLDPQKQVDAGTCFHHDSHRATSHVASNGQGK